MPPSSLRFLDPPDVAQPRGAEQRVGDGVEQHVGVGMPEQAVLENAHAAHESALAPEPAHA